MRQEIEVIAADVTHHHSICELDRKIIGNSSRTEYLLKAISQGNCYIAILHYSVQGFIIFDTSFYNNAFISLLIVDPDHRRTGIARQLIQHVETNSLSEKLFTSTNESNIVMQRVCETLGFIRSGFIENLDAGDPEIIYFKRLR